MKYLIDTNVISELVKQQPNQNVAHFFKNVEIENIYLSVISIGEIRKGIEMLENSAKKQDLKLWLEHAVPKLFLKRIIDINKDIANKWGAILADVKKSVPAIDSLIAATAMTYGLTLVTSNTKDFDMLQIELLNPWLVEVTI